MDPLEEHLPDVGLLEVRDVETGVRKVLDTRSTYVRRAYEQRIAEERAQRSDRFRRMSLDHLVLRTGEDNQSALVLRTRLRTRPNTIVTSVPFHLIEGEVEVVGQ